MKLINDTPWWVFSLIALLLFIGSSLVSIEEEVKMQRTPEQVEAISKQKALEKQTKEYLREEQEAANTVIKQKSWKEVGFSKEAVHKFIAHGYPFWLLGVILILSGPSLMRKRIEN